MKFVKVWKDSRPERGDDNTEEVEEEGVLEETEDRALWEGGGVEEEKESRSCKRSTLFICAGE
jgi:hypothetical protein